MALAAAKARLAALRTEMQRHGLHAYFVPSIDPHQSEYVPECWQRRKWLSGFSGSVGDIVVTQKHAGLWTDGRYHLQAERELAGTGFQLFKQGLREVPSLPEWVSRTLGRDEVLGVDPNVLSRPLAEALEAAATKAGGRLKLLETNLVDHIWQDRPPLPAGPVQPLSLEYAGEPTSEKLRRVREAMRRSGAEALVLTALDAIAWLYNIRGRDVDHNPVVISYGLVTSKEATLFVAEEKVTPALRKALGKKVRLCPYEEMGPALARLGKAKASVFVDSLSVNQWVLGKLKGAKLTIELSPIWRLKARKNPTELNGIRRAHVRDGVAVVRFLHWLEGAVRKGGVTEMTASAHLTALRAEGDRYQADSFEAISGYGPHGAIIHYRVTPDQDVPLRPEGIYLIDSGGQYLDGTTDITRTVLLGGEATAEQKDRFTRVLQGMIALSRSRFPAGTAGRQLDAFARHALWEAGLDYAHGTGHGVGCYLNVHEGPQAISATRCIGIPLEEGNVLSNEPGFYLPGAYGIRLENLMAVVPDEALAGREPPFFRFETLTLCPIERRLVDRGLLSIEERAWLDEYHARVRQTLTPLLSKDAAKWLAQATRPV
ncbi:MAG: aminopeptidase P family protein [Deltaproteobacteria bacterium]|nr:aminopeptidase P family protein [Deltaproteobacteria bacterium]